MSDHRLDVEIPHAQETVTNWLRNDRPVYEYAQRVIAGDVNYASYDAEENLEEFVSEVLYEDSGIFYRQLCRKVPGGYPADRSALLEVRESITMAGFHGISWDDVIDSLRVD